MKQSALLVAAAIAFTSWTHAADDATKDADNTGKNERDKNEQTLTSGDQSNKAEDIKLTADIRQAIVKDDTLSTTAKNVKIITVNHKVTLRGPVNTAAEKSKIEELAKALAGTVPVDNQLEVKTNE